MIIPSKKTFLISFAVLFISLSNVYSQSEVSSTGKNFLDQFVSKNIKLGSERKEVIGKLKTYGGKPKGSEDQKSIIYDNVLFTDNMESLITNVKFKKDVFNEITFGIPTDLFPGRPKNPGERLPYDQLIAQLKDLISKHYGKPLKENLSGKKMGNITLWEVDKKIGIFISTLNSLNGMAVTISFKNEPYEVSDL